ncbi:hypothetical protein PQQ59_17475 [Paraburkholderia aspalathi]|uniref:hypothetical protein n=1 Tax=Paraburkholderia aspalathi TaxID=1324617 RepID=UPI0038BD5A0D
MKFDGWQIPLATIAGVMGASAYFSHPADTSEAVAAWVQAVGSVGAILVAVWVAHRQYEQTRQLELERAAADTAKEQAETVAFVQAMRHEIQVIWDEYEDIRNALHNTPPTGFFGSVVPLGTDSLIVYNHTPDRVGKIDDEALRALIVRTYTGLRGHLNSLRQSNALLDDYEQFYTLYKGDDRLTLHDRKQLIMLDYTHRLRKADLLLETLIKQFLADTEAWVHSKPKRAA